MNLNQAGADLFGVTETRVLAALARLAEPVSGRHLTRLANAESHSTVQRFLTKLRAIGLVSAMETPSATLYRLNREHVLWQPIEDMLAAPARIEQEVAELVASDLGPDARVAVFGSVAKGTAGPRSDYDLLVVVGSDTSSVARAATAERLSRRIEEITGNEGHVVDVDDNELRNLAAHGSAFFLELKSSARPIDGRGPIPQLQVPA
jgi:predicted nucleotidyltransferase